MSEEQAVVTVDVSDSILGRVFGIKDVTISIDHLWMRLGPGPRMHLMTVCVVRSEKPVRMGHGLAVLHPDERYDRAVGERTACRRAIDDYLAKLERSEAVSLNRRAARGILWSAVVADAGWTTLKQAAGAR